MFEDKILIIDDKPINHKVLQKYLLFLGYSNITSTTDPTVFIDEIDSYNLIFLDIKMPKMNGIEFLEKIKTTKMSDIIITTAKVNLNINNILRNCKAILYKPVDLYVLKNILE